MTAWLLAIDPGARSGFSLWQRRGLTGPLDIIAAWVTAPNVVREHVTPDLVVIEAPDRIFGKARPRDILKLSRIVGRYEERYRGSEVRLVTPHAWKGSVDGDIMTDRIRAALTPREVGFAKGLDHNGLDAIGLGKWALRQPWMRGPVGPW